MMPPGTALPMTPARSMWAVRKSFETFRCGKDLHTFACLCGQSRAYRLVRRRGRRRRLFLQCSCHSSQAFSRPIFFASRRAAISFNVC
jgi:hypothetical protein